MSQPKYLEFIQNLPKGGFMRLNVKRPMKMKQGQPQLFKEWQSVVKPGLDYENLQSTIDGRANGALPLVNTGLKGDQRWLVFPYVIVKGDGTYQYKFTRCNYLKMAYSRIVDEAGNIVDRETAKEMAYASEFRSGKEPVMQIKEEDITALCGIDVATLELDMAI